MVARNPARKTGRMVVNFGFFFKCSLSGATWFFSEIDILTPRFYSKKNAEPAIRVGVHDERAGNQNPFNVWSIGASCELSVIPLSCARRPGHPV